MSSLFIIPYFLIYSALGWMIDTGYRSVYAKRFTMNNLLRPLPFCPVYGFGSLLVLSLAPHLDRTPLVVQWIFFGVLLALLEYAAGVFTLRFFHRRLWSYREGPINLERFTNLPHAILWGSLALFLIHDLHPLITYWLN